MVTNDIKEYFIRKAKEYDEKFGYNYWDSHVKFVVDIAKNLALKNGANVEIVEISAILHNIAKVLKEDEDESHNIVGARIAEDLLIKMSYDKDSIELVKKCILHHGGDLDNVCLSKEEWCVRNADILSMFNNITVFFFISFNELKLSYVDGRNLVKEMIFNKYNRLDCELKKQYDEIFKSIYDSI